MTRTIDYLPPSLVLSDKIRLNISTGHLDTSEMIHDFQLIADHLTILDIVFFIKKIMQKKLIANERQRNVVL